MDYICEVAVMHFLTRRGDTFVCPQYPIKDASGGEWSAPDFVALNFAERAIWIVEVSSAADVSGLKRKVINRDEQWILRTKDQLARLDAAVRDWPVVVKVFVREAHKSKFENLPGETKVLYQSLESVMCNWKWDW